MYDGGADDGNGLLTSRTLYVEDGTTGQRVTSYQYDVRGNLLLQTSPTAPHAFHKYDAMNRRVATGLFSSTGGITLGTDDPTTEATNRLALSQTFYDEVGRVWKSQRHEIDASDGSRRRQPPDALLVRRGREPDQDRRGRAREDHLRPTRPRHPPLRARVGQRLRLLGRRRRDGRHGARGDPDHLRRGHGRGR